MLALPDGCEGRGLSARFILSTRCAKSEAKVDAKLTTSNPDVLISKDYQNSLSSLNILPVVIVFSLIIGSYCLSAQTKAFS